MKAFLTILIAFCGISVIQAQLTNSGATIVIESGATLYVEGDITNTTGTIDMKTGSTVELTGDFENAATVTTAGTALLKFSGDTDADFTSGGAVFQDVTIEKTAADVQLLDAAQVNGTLDFNADNNQVLLNGNTLTLTSAATITGADDNEFVVTGSTGELIKEAMSTFTYPVGFDQVSYTPITLTENGTVDNKGVTVLENAYEDGTAGGTQIAEDVVDATWVVSESVAGGSNLDVDAQWDLGDEAASFDRTNCGVSLYNMTAYDLLYSELGAAAGSDPYNRSKTGFSDVGSFIVGGKPALDFVTVEPTVLLTGPLVGTIMSDGLRTNDLIPLTEPYTAFTYFTHVALGGGENVAALADFDQPGTDDDIVDWVFLELRDATTPTTVYTTQSALLQRDGDIVGTDMMPVKFSGFAPGDYHLAVKHKSHLGVMTATAPTLGHSGTILDFSDGSTPTFGTDAQKDVGGTFSLFPGNTDDNNVIDYSGNDVFEIFLATLTHPSNPTFNANFTYSEYSRHDIDMNGTVDYSGNDVFTIFLETLVHPGNTTFNANFTYTEQIP